VRNAASLRAVAAALLSEWLQVRVGSGAAAAAASVAAASVAAQGDAGEGVGGGEEEEEKRGLLQGSSLKNNTGFVYILPLRTAACPVTFFKTTPNATFRGYLKNVTGCKHHLVPSLRGRQQNLQI